MANKFKVGDKVRVVEGGWGVNPTDIGKVTTITAYDGMTQRYCFSTGGLGDYYQHGAWARECSFELVSELDSGPKLVELKYGAVTVMLDATVQSSRQLAEVFLNVIYEDAKR